jgi:hypothetical protein
LLSGYLVIWLSGLIRCFPIAASAAYLSWLYKADQSASGQKPSPQIAVVSVNGIKLTFAAEPPIHPVDNF